MGRATDFPEAFARVVAERMKTTGLSASEFAIVTGIPRVTLNRKLQGQDFKGTEMAAIAAALNTTVTELTKAAEILIEDAA